MEIQTIATDLQEKRTLIAAETLTLVAHKQMSRHFAGPLFGREFIWLRLDGTSTFAKEAISLAYHDMAGVSHSFSFQ